MAAANDNTVQDEDNINNDYDDSENILVVEVTW